MPRIRNTLANPNSTYLSVVLPEKYGAKADGATDDTAAIHAARDAAGSGGQLVFARGKTYLVNGLTASVAGQNWDLNGATLKIAAATSTYGLQAAAAGVTITNGTIDGSAVTPGNLDNPVHAAASGVTFRRVTVVNSPGYGIKGINVGQFVVDRCTVTNSKYEGIWAENNASGAADLYDFSITDCYIDNSSGGTSSRAGGVTVWTYSNTHKNHRINISRNTVLLPYSQTFGAAGIVGVVNGTDFTVNDNVGLGGNIAISCPNAINGTISGNALKGFSQYGIEIPTAPVNVSILGNSVDGDSVGFRGVSHSSGAAVEITIMGNVFRNLSTTSESAIYLGQGGSITGFTISGNTLPDTLASRSAILFGGTTTSGSVVGNQIDGNSAASSVGVQFLGATTGVIIAGNSFSNLARAAVLLGAGSGALDYINVDGNQVVNCGATYLNATFGSATVGSHVAVKNNNDGSPSGATDIQIFTANGTWTKPTGAVVTTIITVAPGGGGGSGRRGAAGTVRTGGAGGGGGGRGSRTVASSVLGATEAVTVGAIGTGGAAVTTDDTNGNNGTAAGNTVFGNWVRAIGGGAGNGGTTTAASGGAAGGSMFPGSSGGQSNTTGAGSASSSPNDGAGGGGGGGSITAADAVAAGGLGAGPSSNTYANGAAGTSPGGAGGAGGSAPSNSGVGVAGGGGGGSSITGAGGAGGAGGLYGGGGGGGGGSLNGNNSGAGGAGNAGICVVITATT